jgi:hypothetical protein
MRAVPPQELVAHVSKFITDDDTQNHMSDAFAQLFVLGTSHPNFHASSEGVRFGKLGHSLGVTADKLEHSMNSLRLTDRLRDVNDVTVPLSAVRRGKSAPGNFKKGASYKIEPADDDDAEVVDTHPYFSSKAVEKPGLLRASIETTASSESMVTRAEDEGRDSMLSVAAGAAAAAPEVQDITRDGDAPAAADGGGSAEK